MWRPDDVIQIAARAIAGAEAARQQEQAVYGLDALDEVGLHPVLADGFEQAGLGVYRERPYPGEVARRAKTSERERCDLVLTQDPNVPLIDPVDELKAVDGATGTLFEPVAEAVAAAASITELGQAFWLEVKAVAQHAYVDGVPVPNRSYANQLVRGPAKDIVKLAREPMIETAAELVVLFACDEDVARHDLTAVAHKLLDRDLPISAPLVECVQIEDRAGNGVCAIGLFPVRL